jgi:hypothetical protein
LASPSLPAANTSTIPWLPSSVWASLTSWSYSRERGEYVPHHVKLPVPQELLEIRASFAQAFPVRSVMVLLGLVSPNSPSPQLRKIFEAPTLTNGATPSPWLKPAESSTSELVPAL